MNTGRENLCVIYTAEVSRYFFYSKQFFLVVRNECGNLRCFNNKLVWTLTFNRGRVQRISRVFFWVKQRILHFSAYAHQTLLVVHRIGTFESFELGAHVEIRHCACFRPFAVNKKKTNQIQRVDTYIFRFTDVLTRAICTFFGCARPARLWRYWARPKSLRISRTLYNCWRTCCRPTESRCRANARWRVPKPVDGKIVFVLWNVSRQ